MPTATYTPIANVTLTDASAAVTITGIDQSFKDIVIVIEGWVTARTGQYITLNGDGTDANYFFVYAQGNGTSATSGSGNYRGLTEVFENSSTNRTVMRLQLQDYSATDKHKSILIRADNIVSGNGAEMRSMRWANTGAVTSITLEAVGTTWGANTSFAMYGIAA